MKINETYTWYRIKLFLYDNFGPDLRPGFCFGVLFGFALWVLI